MVMPPGTGYNAAVDDLRITEYPMLKDSIYLDHAGTTLYPKSLIDGFAREMTANLLGNPHSASPSSQLATSRIEDTRLRALQFFNADPAEFDLVFVANATAGIKLIAEALRASPDGFDYVYHQASHTSLVGLREEARNSFCLDDDHVAEWLCGHNLVDQDFERPSALLFAYPGQSNMDGTRYPLDWSHRLRSLDRLSGSSVYTLLDAAALAATSPLDMSNSTTAPDFTVLSFSKIFGFPDLGALIVRRQAESVFGSRKYFGGGTVDTVVCHKEQWHAPKSHHLHERLEDGTLPVHSIIALDLAISTHQKLFGSMSNVESHVSYLTTRLYDGLRGLCHRNGASVCEIYSPVSSAVKALGNGPIIALNLRNQDGVWASLTEVDKLAALKGYHVRTGGVCNPGGISSALNLQPWELKRNFSAGFRCGSENDVIAGKPTGVLRVSLGAMSTVSDVDAFVAFLSEFYCEDSLPSEIPPRVNPRQHELFISDITVYPIKSCGGCPVPKHTDWEVRPEGLAWDREWCLLHQGTAQALSQKRYPKMALIRPVLDFETGQLRVTFAGDVSEHQPSEIRVPLSSNPALFRRPPSPHGCRTSRVCGEEIVAKTYESDEINGFFSAALGVPCMLARFPPGGQEGSKSARHSKAHLQKHQKTCQGSHNTSHPLSCSPRAATPAGLCTSLPSPPDSDTEEKQRPRILLSNESPILAINMASVRAINQEISARSGGNEIAAAVFRANIVLDTNGHTTNDYADLAYAEDTWSTLRVGDQQQHEFRMLGSCRRCHMVCIDQATGAKGEEPFVTLSKTRRFEGKVFFGTHMCHVPPRSRAGTETRAAHNPVVRIGDRVVAEWTDTRVG